MYQHKSTIKKAHWYIFLFLMVLMAFSYVRFAHPEASFASAQTSLSYSPQTSTFPLNNPFTLSILINSRSNSVISSDIVIKYNPAILQGVNITPGTFLPSPQTVQKSINNTLGEMVLSFYTAKTNATSGQGEFATLTFRPIAIGTGTVTFDTTKTLVYSSGEGNSISELGSGVYTITAATSLTSPTPTGIVSQTPVPTSSQSAAVTITVLDTNETPIKNTTILATDQNGNTYEAISNDKGEVTFPNLPTGVQNLSIQSKDAQGKTTPPSQVTVENEKPATVIIDNYKDTKSFLSGYVPILLAILIGTPIIVFIVILFIHYRKISTDAHTEKM